MSASRLAILGMLFAALWLLGSWNSLLSKGLLNLGYVQIANSLVAHGVSFSETESLCQKGWPFSFDHASSGLDKALMTLEYSTQYQRSASSYLGIGMIHLVLGDPAQARNILQDGLAMDTHKSRFYMLLGCAHLQSGEKEAAIAQWRSVPHFGEWRIRRGHMLRLNGDWEASNRDYYAVVQVNPSSYLFHMIAWNHVNLGQIDKAIAAYQSAIELGLPDRGVNYVPEMSRLELARIYIAQEDWLNAKIELDAAIAGQPAMAEAYEQLGLVYYRGFGDLPQANRLLLRSLEINPNAPKPYLYLGSFNRAQKEYTTAEKWLRNGLALPTNMWTPWLHGELGRVYFDQKRYDEAILEFETVYDAVPTDIWYLELLGDAYSRIGNIKQAARYYREALNINPSHERIQKKIIALGDALP